jgi:Ras-related protein Rab-11A
MTEKINLSAIKVGLLGDSSVGKTAICNALMNIEFAEDMLSTIGSDRLETKFPLKNGKQIKLVLWDTAGQERFRSVALTALKAAQGVVVVFDVTKRVTFENVDNWLKEIKDNLSNPHLVLFGNKADLPNREVTENEAKKYAKKMNLEYFETSAKTKQGLNNGFSYLVNDIYDKAEGKSDEEDKKEKDKINLGKKVKEPKEKTGCFGKKKKSAKAK